MSKDQYIVALERELTKLNKQIDLKIIRGENYSFESRKHKMLKEISKKYKKPTFFAHIFPMMLKY